MLVLTRSNGEMLKIGDDIEIIVLDIKGRQVRIGINVPADVVVNREEAHKRIQKEKY